MAPADDSSRDVMRRLANGTVGAWTQPRSVARRFTDNFVRLLGLHGLSQNFTAQLLGVSEASMSAWMNGRSTPSLAKAIDIAELFQISTDRLMGAEFAELLQTELADPERFKRVEARIRRASTPLKTV